MSVRLFVRGLFDSLTAGFVPPSGGGTANFLRADGAWVAPSGGAVLSPFYDTTIVPATITFGAAFDNWNVGTLGQNTLIQYITDGVPPGSSSRAVRGLVGGSLGKIVTLMNMSNSSGAGQFAHESASASAGNKFHNAGAATVTGGPQGCITYFHDGSIWRHIWSTAP